MTNGFPRSQPQLPDDHEGWPQPSFHRSQAEYAFLPSPGPTVVVRRRRRVLPDITGTVPGTPGADAGGPAAKTPKVFTLSPPNVAGELSPAEPPSLTAPRRRRRNELRAPVLLRHVVFEAAPPAPGDAAPSVPEPARDSFVPRGDARGGYEAVCAALDGVRRVLDRVDRARRFHPFPRPARD